MVNSLIHELTHAGQYCNENNGGLPKEFKRNTCDFCICSEIQAYAAEPVFAALVATPDGLDTLAALAMSSCAQKNEAGDRIGVCKDQTKVDILRRGKEIAKKCAIPLKLK